jgi:general secretion pathway protein G
MFARMRDARKNESGFTLIELLIVIVILGVLSGIVVFSVAGITDRGAVAACKSDRKTVQVASEAYFAQNGGYAADIGLLSPSFLQTVPADVTYVAGGTALTPPAITAPCPL